MNEKLIQIAYRMERQAERMLKQARQLREMASRNEESRGRETKAFEFIRELRHAGDPTIH